MSSPESDAYVIGIDFGTLSGREIVVDEYRRARQAANAQRA